MLNFLSFVHTVPFVIICLMFLWKACSKFLLKRAQNQDYDHIVLLLCAAGITAGSIIHSGEHVGAEGFHVFDPCLGYALVLIVLAAKFAKGAILKSVVANKIN
jgi:hypothetical protein